LAALGTEEALHVKQAFLASLGTEESLHSKQPFLASLITEGQSHNKQPFFSAFTTDFTVQVSHHASDVPPVPFEYWSSLHGVHTEFPT